MKLRGIILSVETTTQAKSKGNIESTETKLVKQARSEIVTEKILRVYFLLDLVSEIYNRWNFFVLGENDKN